MAAFASQRYLALAMLVCGLSLPLLAAPRLKKHKAAAAVVVGDEFASDIQPILEAHCTRCHGKSKQKGGLRLDTADGIHKGGDGGAVIAPGSSGKSLLVEVLTAAEDRPRMPPSGLPLESEQVAKIRHWIDAGARSPEQPTESSISVHASDHWAFRPPVSAVIPTVRDPAWQGNPIDAFLGAGHEATGLTANAAASQSILLRRVYLDLIGVPPSREELHAFLNDTSPDAYEKIVERLLASSSHGERWARHWMDIWRYSEADGRKSKADVWWSSPHLWRWRDWIVQSLNQDLGYDRMIIAMLAGDEIAPHDPAVHVATGFLVRNWFKLDRNIWLGNTVEHTAKAFLGLTINCAKCHDHKFDPISQKDYYRFRAYFETHDIRDDAQPGEKGKAAFYSHAIDGRRTDPTWIFIRGDDKIPDKSTKIHPGTPAAFGGKQPRILSTDQSSGRRLALARWIGSRQNPLTARVAVNHIWARHFGRPLVDHTADFGIRTQAPLQRELLDWLAVEFMAHGWSMKHLHRLIVTSRAYRLSSSERGASIATQTADPENKLYWRMNSRRMEAEVIRDSLLSLADILDPTMGGPSIHHDQGMETARRSLYYRYSREDKMGFVTSFDAPGVEECYRRQESIVPQQALALENSPFVWDQTRRITQRLASRLREQPESGEREQFIIAAFEHVLGRSPQQLEIATCEHFLIRQEKLLADPSRLTPFPLPFPRAKPNPEFLKRASGLPLVLGTAPPLPRVPPAGEPAGRAREYLIHALLNHNDFITIR